MMRSAEQTVRLERGREQECEMLELAEIEDVLEEGAVRTRNVKELLESLSESRKIMLDSNKDLKTRERWTQLHNSTSQILNTVLRDLQMKEWERRLRVIEEHAKRPRLLE